MERKSRLSNIPCIADVIADALLVIIPSQLVYKVRLSRAQKIRIFSIFSASAITTLVCLVHAYYVFTGGGLKEAIAGLFEVRFLTQLSPWCGPGSLFF